MAVSRWFDDLQDNPDNYLIVADGELRLDNPNVDNPMCGASGCRRGSLGRWAVNPWPG